VAFAVAVMVVDLSYCTGRTNIEARADAPLPQWAARGVRSIPGMIVSARSNPVFQLGTLWRAKRFIPARLGTPRALC